MADITMRVDVALAEVPVNIMPLIDDGDFKTVEDSVAYDAAGMDLSWVFVTANGAMSRTPVTPTNAGVHDWVNQGDGMYSLEIPAAGGTINNDTEGFGWFIGKVTGVLPFRGPIIQFVPDAIADIEDGSAALGVSQTGDNYAIINGASGNVAIKTAIDGLNDISSGGVEAAVNAALIDYDAVTDASLATALGTSDDAVLAAIAALNNLSSAGAQAAAEAALTAYSAATAANVSAVPAAVLTAAQASPIHADGKRLNGATVQGNGTAGNLWRG
jgi:hypothetical protein